MPGIEAEAMSRRKVLALLGLAAAGVAASGEAALAIGVHALAALLADEGDSAILAVAQRLPIALGRRLLAAADLIADGVGE